MDIVLDAFEESWKKGLSPDVMTYSRVVDPRFHKRLLRELILTERECFNFLGKPSDSKIDSNLGTVQINGLETVHDSPGKRRETDRHLPTHFDRFAIIKLLGRGSHGVVYEAEDLEIRRRVAIKIAHSSTGDPVASRAFANEAANASRVDHPSIVRILQVGEYRGKNFMVSELIEGSSLFAFAASQKMDDIACSQIVADVAAGIDAAHRSGVIHRDLKPSNIMIECIGNAMDNNDSESPAPFSQDTSRVRILDFGIAKMLDRLTHRTTDGDIVGTPHYMSPEQAAGNSANVDQRSDIFSLGVVLFELLCGKLPFDGSEVAVVSGIRDLKVPRIRSIRPNIPVALEQIVHMCLEKSPAHRYQSAAALETDLRHWIAGKKPFVLLHRQVRQFALCSALLLSIGSILGISFVAGRSGWFTKIKFQPIAGVGYSSSVGSNDSDSPSNPLQRKTQLSSWMKQGQPQSLLRWIENVDGDSSVLIAELDTMRLERGWDELQRRRLRLAQLCLSSGADSESADVRQLSRDIAGSQDPAQEKYWSKLLGRMPNEFVRELESQLNLERDPRQRRLLFGVLTHRKESSADTPGLLRLLQVSQTEELSRIVPALLSCSEQSNLEFEQLLGEELDGIEAKMLDVPGSDEAARWRAKLALVAFGLGQWEQVDRILSFSTDPTSRNYFIYWFNQCEYPIEPLLDRFSEYQDDWRSMAVLACLSTLPRSRLSEDTYLKSGELLCKVYEQHPSSGIHSAARVQLLSRGEHAFVEKIDANKDSRIIKDDRNWYINPEGMQMNIIRGPGEYWFGKPMSDAYLPGRIHRITHTYAISDKAVSEMQFSRFNSTKFTSPNESIAKGISWRDAILYCDWLNDKEDIEHRKSIEAIDSKTLRLDLSENGYRLPSVWEWEFFARRGTTTKFSFGEPDSEYGRSIYGSKNDPLAIFGHGSESSSYSKVPEWTSTLFWSQNSNDNLIKANDMVVVKGGFFSDLKSALPLSEYKLVNPNNTKNCGFRIARTID